jgi:ribosomal protein S18 acetylase RimI-like enzyme
MVEKLNIKIEIARLEDAYGIHEVLLQNLIEIRDFDIIPDAKKKVLEKTGFLRKEEPKEYYENLIKDEKCDIYIAKRNGIIIGFASIHKKKYNIANFRSTLDNLYTDDEKVKELLTSEKKEFSYLDQVSIIPDDKRKGVGKALVNKILEDLNVPMVSFIVKEPLANIASIHWHEALGFELSATCDGKYKGKKFEWWIYIHWNKK